MSDRSTMFVISVAATLAGMHPQTLRQYDRLGLVSPSRTMGRGRRYTADDVDRLREIQRLSHEDGVNLAGIKQILDLQRRVTELEVELESLRGHHHRVFAADAHGQVVPLRRGERPLPPSRTGALVVWKPST